MAWSLVAKVEHMVVEMVEKVVVKMGSLVFHGGKEEEEGGMEVLLLLEMEEEVEENEVEKLVVEMEGKVVEKGGAKVDGQGKFHGCVSVGCHALCWKKGGEQK